MDAVSLGISPATTPAAANSGNAKAAGTTVQAQIDPPAPVSASEDTYWSPKHFAQNVDQFKNLTSTVLDTSSKYSDADRVSAYSSLWEMAVKGKLSGMDADAEKLYSKAIIESDIGRRAAEIQQQGNASLIAANSRGESVANDKLKFIAGLSEDDQRLNFSISENGFDAAGNRQYASFNSYRDQLVANAAHDNPGELSASLKTVKSSQTGDAWGKHILSLFGSVGLDSSPRSTAQAADVSFSASKLPLSYQPGSIFTRVA